MKIYKTTSERGEYLCPENDVLDVDFIQVIAASAPVNSTDPEAWVEGNTDWWNN